MAKEKNAINTSYFSIVSNILLAIIKALAGIFGNSYALIADAIESTSDVISSLLVFFGLKYAKRPADDNHPYGHGKIEPMVTFIVVGFLVVSATLIAIESIKNIGNPHKIPEPWTLIVLAAIIVYKEICYRVISSRANVLNSTSLKADALHHRSDSFTSITAFVGIAIALVFGKGYESADDWAALLASGLIYYHSYKIFRPAFAEIMDENIHDQLIDSIRQKASEVDGIIDTEKCFVRKAGAFYHIDLHATVDAHISVKEGHRLAHKLQDALKQNLPNIGQVLIHIEPNEY